MSSSAWHRGCLLVCDVTAAGERRGSPPQTRPGLLRSPPSLRCAMRHCGRSGLSVCVSVCVSVCWSEGHRQGLHHIKKRECRQWSRGAAHCWTQGHGWTCASVNPPIVHLHLAKTDGSSTHAVTCPIPRVRAPGRWHGWHAKLPQLRVWRAGLKRPCPSPAPSVVCVIPARRSRG